jgi:cobalt/nickel transport system ATP-binding protein
MRLTFHEVSFTYPGITSRAVDTLNLEIETGERVALVGHNGGGKTTLILLACGLLRPDHGQVCIDDQPIQYDRRGLTTLRKTVSVVFQNPEDQLFSASLLQDISLGPLNLGLSPAEARQRVLEAATLCELTELLERPTHALSGGEKARAALAGILAMDPLFLFADELTNSLDPWMRYQMLAILEHWVQRGKSVVLSTHDWNLAHDWAERILWIENGQIYRQGPPDILDNVNFKEVPQ